MVPNRKFCMFIFCLLAYTTVSPCFAQSYGDAFGSSAASRAVPVEDESYQIGNPGSPMVVTPESAIVRTPTVPMPATDPAAPILQGASCGTIGPQGGDATSIMGVNTAAQAPAPPRELPFITIFLFATMLISAIFWCLKCVFKQKKTPMWVLGVIAACLFAIAGLAWSSAKKDAQGNIGVSYGYGGTAVAVDTPPELNESDSNSAASSATVTGGTLIIQDYKRVDDSQ